MLLLTRHEKDALALRELERRQRLSDKLRGKRRPEDVRRRVSEGLKRSWSERPRTARQNSTPHNRAISEGLKRWWSERPRAERPRSEHPHSASHNRAISEGLKRWWAARKAAAQSGTVSNIKNGPTTTMVGPSHQE